MGGRMRAVALVLAASMMACSSVQVTTEADPSVDFAAYRSYDWLMDGPLDLDDARIDEAELDGWIRADVDQGLAILGLEQKETDADLLLSYRVMLDGGTEVFQFRDETYVRNYKQGAFILDMVDAANGRLVFSGRAEGEARLDTITKAERRARTRDILRRILAELPRKASTTAHARWVHDDGSRVPRVEVDAAMTACDADEAVVDRVNQTSRSRYRYHAWGGAMLRCLADHDIHLGNPPID